MTVKNWTFAYETAPEDQSTATLQAASLHKQRKDFLVAGGWTVTRSCNPTDGVVAGDCLTDLADYVWSASGDRSWMELKSPEGFYPGRNGTYTGDQSRAWLTVHLNSTDVYKAEIYLHNTVPTGTASTTACPTTSTKLGYTAQQMLRSAFVGNAIFHFSRTSQGSWFELVGYTAAGMTPWAFFVFPFTEVNHNPDTGKSFPFATMVWGLFRDTGKGPLEFTTSAGSLMVSPGLNAAANAVIWTKTGATNDGGTVVFLGWRNSLNQAYALGDTFSAVTRDDFSYSFPSSQLYVKGRIPYYMVGKIADIEMSYAPYSQGDTDSATSPTKVYMGSLLLPTNTLVTL